MNRTTPTLAQAIPHSALEQARLAGIEAANRPAVRPFTILGVAAGFPLGSAVALNRHVPELVLLLLFGTFVLTGSMVGYTSGIAGHRAIFPTYVLMTLIVFVVFLIVDLDRPRRGLVVVSHRSLVDVRTTLHGTAIVSVPQDSAQSANSSHR